MAYKSIEITGPATVVNQTIKQNQFYTGYSTVDPAATSVRLYDYSLIKQDILNQFNTRQGERVMNPKFGTIIWDLLFEPFTGEVRDAIVEDVRRICTSDPRAVPIKMNIDQQEYGLLLEITNQYVGTDQTSNMVLNFNKSIGLTS